MSGELEKSAIRDLPGRFGRAVARHWQVCPAWLPESMQQKIRQRYKLGRPPRAGRDWEPDLSKPFPKSRRLRALRKGGETIAGVPLGWVLVVFKERKA